MYENVIVCDIDGVLLDVSKLYKILEELPEDERLEYFNKNANNHNYVSKNKIMFDMLNAFNRAGFTIILLTARARNIGPETCMFLGCGEVSLDNIAMIITRNFNMEGVPSEQYKRQAIEELKTMADIKLIIDDDLDNCNMFEQMGYTVMRVMDKNNPGKII